MSQPIWFTKMLESIQPEVFEEWYERAAILQYDAGYSKEHSECLALLLVASKYDISLCNSGDVVSYLNKEDANE